MMKSYNKKLSVLIMTSVRWYNASAHYALYQAKNLTEAGMDATLLGIPGSPVIKKARESGIEVIEDINLMKGGLSYFSQRKRFKKILSDKEFNIINPHISRDHTFVFLLYLFLKKKSIPVVRTRTDSIPPKKNIFNKLFYKFAARHYIVSSKRLKSDLLEMGIDGRIISIIPLEMNYKKFSAYTPVNDLKKKLNIPKEKAVISFIGRLDKVKGVEYFVKSYNYLDRNDPVHYLISGEEINVSVKELRDLAEQLDIKNITFLERVDNVREILSITDIGVIPSMGSEAICRIALEMLSFGIPIIGSNINSIPEIILDFHGIVVNPGAPEEIAGAIKYFLHENNYKKIKPKIKSGISKRNLEKFTIEHLNIYLDLMEN